MTSIKAMTAPALIDGGGNVVRDAVLVIEGDRIRAAGSAARVDVPPNAKRIDARGCTLMPGLIDAHVHLD